MKKTVLYAGFVLTASLFQGCSGHTLQDLIDGNSTNGSSSEQVVQSNADSTPVAPSQNKALNSISPSTTASDEHEEHRYMQKNTNAWIENEWEPLTEGNTTTTKEDNLTTVPENNMTSSDDINSTGLQYYVDKAEIYFENKEKRDANKTKAPSHVDKINSMPGIGKSSD